MEVVNHTLARYSDLCYGTALTVYVIGMVLMLWSLASARPVRRIENQSKVLVGANGTESVDDRAPGRVVDQPKPPLGDRLAKMGMVVAIVGLVSHIVSIVLRGFATDRAPWGNMYEFISIMCATGVLAGVVLLRKPDHRALMLFVLFPAVILMFIGGVPLYANPAPVVPALKSYWLAIHVSIVSVGSGVFMVSGVASLLYLFKMRYPTPNESSIGGRILARVPSAQVLDRFAYKTVVFAFPLFGLGVVCGAIWAEAAWGRYWGWDPKETTSFIAWIIYAAYLHARATAGWRNRAAAWINIAGFSAVLFNTFAINLVVSGLHSYQGL